MSSDDGQKAGKPRAFRVVKGGRCDFRRRLRARQVPTKAELELDRRMQTAFALLTDPAGNVPGKRCYRIREGDGFPWRVLARALVDFRRRRVARGQIKTITATLDAWVDDLCDSDLNALDFPKAA